MFTALGSAQGIVTLILGLVAFAAEVFALVDAVRHRPDAYLAAGKRTKQFWSIVLGVAMISGTYVLTDTIKAAFLPPDHPLFLLLTEPRRMQYAAGEAVWCRLVDVGAALEARGYGEGAGARTLATNCALHSRSSTASVLRLGRRWPARSSSPQERPRAGATARRWTP